MAHMQNQYDLIDNKERKQYEFHIDGLVPRIEYIKVKEKVYLTHTEVPKALEGKGVASQLVHQVLLNIASESLTLIPMCPFVALYVKRHPEWKKLVLKGIHIGDS